MIRPNFGDVLDPRLNKRAQSLLSSMFRGASSSILRISSNRAEQIGNYRFLHNESVTEEILIEEQRQRCKQQAKDRPVLCIHDTTEANFFNHSNRLKRDTNLGYIDASNKGIGFKAHASFVIDAKSYIPYGISNLILWHRKEKVTRSNHETKKLPLNEKESYKWIEGCQKSNELLTKAAKVIHIQDREGDIYEQIEGFEQDGRTFYIIRSKCDRNTMENQKLYESVSVCKKLGSYILSIKADSHGKSGRREAQMEVRILKTKVKSPKSKNYSKEITLIETKEVNCPDGCEPLIWRLITTCSVSTFKDAIQVIEWYTARWYIEELFKVVKKENLNIEASELETGWALRKLFIMLVDTAIKLFQYYVVREIPEGETVETISSFSQDEFTCLAVVGKTLEGKTSKQKNPYKKNSNQWVVWILGRMGGWTGYASQRKAGMTTIILGLERFYHYYAGWNASHHAPNAP